MASDTFVAICPYLFLKFVSRLYIPTFPYPNIDYQISFNVYRP